MGQRSIFYFYTFALIFVSILKNNNVFCQYNTGVHPGRPINLMAHLQPNDIGKNEVYDTLPDDGVRCARDCTLHPERRLCYYQFTVEQYSVMGRACGNCSRNQKECFNPQCIPADGVEKMLLSISRQLPGPSIQVCYNDRVVIDVLNRMPGRTIAIHWHGILQEQSPWMDGVQYVSQCPFGEGQTFRYNYLAGTVGSFFYHAHTSFQILDGISGSLVVRTSKVNDSLAAHYDFDKYSHVIIITDWLHDYADSRFPGYYRNKTLYGVSPDNYLINGQGSYNNSGTPLAVFKVRPPFRYRFRFIGASALTCSFKVTVQNHAMLLLAVDGYPVTPVVVRSLLMSAGTRFDVVITANQPPSAYWIYVQGQGTCASTSQRAILSYEGSPVLIPPIPVNITSLSSTQIPSLNEVSRGCNNPKDTVCLQHLDTLLKVPPVLVKPIPDRRVILDASGYKFSADELFKSNTYDQFYLPGGTLGAFADTFNNVSNMMPPVSLINQLNDPMLHNMTCPNICQADHCACVHLLKFRLGEVVELIFLDSMSTSKNLMEHPMHIHGHNWIVLKQGTATERAALDLENYNFVTKAKPAVSDVMLVPAMGFAVARFHATNPGMWVMHCHYSFHNHNGMMIIFQVGQPQDWASMPTDLPTCNNYMPPVNFAML